MHKIRCKVKHRFLIFILLYISLVSFEVNAQITVRNTDLPSIGQNYTIITYAVPPNIKIKPGDFFTKNIDFSLFKRVKSDTIRYLSAPKTRYGKQFPTSTIAAISTAQQITYYKTDSNSVMETGIIGDFMNIGKPVLISFEKPIRKYKLPLKYKDYLRDTSENKLVTPYFIIPGIDSIRADVTIIKETVIDSFGTVITPYKVFETLREKETVLIIVAGYKFSMFGWTPAPEYS
ncbi:MAG TPA: hypothetical protein DCQ31_18840, partial [Bacteroidales bacterium]|nr:hypothetical protein [Bacteroidales bacterium]